MKIIDVKELQLNEVKVIRFGRFTDHRGYFTEPYRQSDFQGHPELSFIHGIRFYQTNESFSKSGTLRGLHFQWNPYMGKLVRTIYGRMVDLVMDIRKGSPNYGKIIAYEMPADFYKEYSEWIWVPPGFAHGNYYTTDSLIEYFCSGEYSPGCEASLSPLSKDIDWSFCSINLKQEFDTLITGNLKITEKDKNGLNLKEWLNDVRSENFIYGKV